MWRLTRNPAARSTCWTRPRSGGGWLKQPSCHPPQLSSRGTKLDNIDEGPDDKIGHRSPS